MVVGLPAIPLLRDRGPVERLQARVDGDGGRAAAVPARLIERLASLLGPRLAPAIRASRRESIDRRLDLAGRPGGVTVQRFVGYKARGG